MMIVAAKAATVAWALAKGTLTVVLGAYNAIMGIVTLVTTGYTMAMSAASFATGVLSVLLGGAYTVAIGAATIATTAFGVVLAILTSPITLIIAAIALLAAAFATDFMGIRTTVTELAFLVGYTFDSWVHTIGDFISGTLNFFGQFFTQIWHDISTVITTAGDIVVGVFKTIGGWVDWGIGVFNRFATIIGDIWNGISTGVSLTWSTITSLIETAITNVKNIFTGLGDSVKTVWDRITGFFSGIGDTVKGVFIGAVNFVIDQINGVIRTLNGAISIARNLPGLGGIGDIGEIPKIASYARGTGFHPGGAAIMSELMPELLKLPGGPLTVVPSPTLFSDLPRGSQVLPLAPLATNSAGGAASGGRLGGGNTYVINQTFNVNGNPDQSAMKQMADIAKKAAQEALQQPGRDVNSRAAFNFRR